MLQPREATFAFQRKMLPTTKWEVCFSDSIDKLWSGLHVYGSVHVDATTHGMCVYMDACVYVCVKAEG